jgi:hypothetical protein
VALKGGLSSIISNSASAQSQFNTTESRRQEFDAYVVD